MIKAMRTPQPARRMVSEEPALPAEAVPGGARGRVLTASLSLFADHGYAGTSVRDICSLANVRATTLYTHYPSKEHVLAELLLLGHQQHFRRLRAALLESQPDPLEQLSALVRAHVIGHCQYSKLAVVANSELHSLSAEMAAPVLTQMNQSWALLADVFERGVRLGLFKVPDSNAAQQAIASMGMRVAFWYAPQSGQTPEQMGDLFAEFARRIVGRMPA